MPVRDSRVVVADMGTESKGSTEIQEGDRQDKGVLQDRVVLQGVCCDRQDCWELQGLQEALNLETVEVLQTGRQEGQGRREAWAHVEGNLLVPEVGVDEVVEGQRSRCRRRHRGLRQVVRGWVVEKPLREEVRS